MGCLEYRDHQFRCSRSSLTAEQSKMLEQRRAKQKGYITLREAAALYDLAPNYIRGSFRYEKNRHYQVVFSASVQQKMYPNSALLLRFSSSFHCVAISFLLATILFLQYVFYVAAGGYWTEELGWQPFKTGSSPPLLVYE